MASRSGARNRDKSPVAPYTPKAQGSPASTTTGMSRHPAVAGRAMVAIGATPVRNRITRDRAVNTPLKATFMDRFNRTASFPPP